MQAIRLSNVIYVIKKMPSQKCISHFENQKGDIFFKRCLSSPDWCGSLGWVIPQTQQLPVQCPARAHAWLSGQVPRWGCVRGNQLLFLSCSVSLPSPLSKKIFFLFSWKHLPKIIISLIFVSHNTEIYLKVMTE